MQRMILCLCLLTTLTTSAYSSSGDVGSIRGTVTDQYRKPIAGARVHIAEAKPFFGHRILRFYGTDSAGQFVIENVPWGTYFLLAGKEDEGYPDTKLAFYSNLKVPKVTLAPATPVASATIKLGPKAGVIQVVAIDNAVTGQPVDSASITVRRAGRF